MPPINIPSPSSPFPTFLLPSLPFRRRQSSTTSTTSTSTSSSSSSNSSSTPPQNDSNNNTPTYLTTSHSHLRCARCLSDLALTTQIISKGFMGRHGRAYLVAPSNPSTSCDPTNTILRTAKQKDKALPNLPNTFTHRPVHRELVTGAHTVGDISCAQCGSVLGWKYIAAAEEAQRYKVGKFILETKKVLRSCIWEGEEDGMGNGMGGAGQRRTSSLAMPPSVIGQVAVEDEAEFDSQNEDECEDLFLGVWTPQLAARRRRGKIVE